MVFFIPRVEEDIKVAENSNLHKKYVSSTAPRKKKRKKARGTTLPDPKTHKREVKEDSRTAKHDG
jgi:hypothetical protein